MVCERVAVEGVQGQLHAPLASRLGADDERLERDGDSDDTDLEEGGEASLGSHARHDGCQDIPLGSPHSMESRTLTARLHC